LARGNVKGYLELFLAVLTGFCAADPEKTTQRGKEPGESSGKTVWQGGAWGKEGDF